MGFREWFGGRQSQEEVGVPEPEEKEPTGVRLKGKITEVPEIGAEQDVIAAQMDVYESTPGTFSPGARDNIRVGILTTRAELDAARLGGQDSKAYEFNNVQEKEDEASQTQFATTGALRALMEIQKGAAMIPEVSEEVSKEEESETVQKH